MNHENAVNFEGNSGNVLTNRKRDLNNEKRLNQGILCSLQKAGEKLRFTIMNGNLNNSQYIENKENIHPDDEYGRSFRDDSIYDEKLSREWDQIRREDQEERFKYSCREFEERYLDLVYHWFRCFEEVKDYLEGEFTVQRKVQLARDMLKSFAIRKECIKYDGNQDPFEFELTDPNDGLTHVYCELFNPDGISKN